MPNQVVNGAMLTCSFGMAPSALTVLPVNRVQTEHQPAATIQDHVPNVNIMPFGMCTTPTNPQVAAATTAAAGCSDAAAMHSGDTSPWVPGAVTVQIGNQARARQHLEVHVHVAGRDHRHQPGRSQRTDSLRNCPTMADVTGPTGLTTRSCHVV